MHIMIKMPKKEYQNVMRGRWEGNPLAGYIENGVPLPKGHGFIAICDSDLPITEEVKQELKNTVFVGDEACNYCFDMTEIIEADEEAEG